jgi:hypothetical protein
MKVSVASTARGTAAFAPRNRGLPPVASTGCAEEADHRTDELRHGAGRTAPPFRLRWTAFPSVG